MILRPVTWDDRDLLFRWRNDPSTLASLPNPTRVTKSEHRHWLQVMFDKQVPMFIAEYQGIPVGTGRLDSRQEVSITIAPEYRGQGYATPLIIALGTQARSPLLARVLPGNLRSSQAFLRAGYRRINAEWYEPELGDEIREALR